MHSVQQFLQMLTQRLAPVWQWLHSELDSILASPHRWIAYVVAAAVAVLLIAIPLLRGSRRRRRRTEPFEEVRSYSVLGIGPTPAGGNDFLHRQHYPRWADAAPLPPHPVPPPISNAASIPQQPVPPPTSVPPPISNATPVPQQPVPPPISNAAPVNPPMSVACTHCGATLPASQNFCPACGFAQPAHQSVTA
jgi:hypothetical protein